MYNDKDDFGKMDLNFDPTVEAKVNIEEQPKPTVNQNVYQPQQPVQPTVQPQQPVQPTKPAVEKPAHTVDESVIASFNNHPEQPTTISNENDLKAAASRPIDHSQPMDKTLEFIIQNDPVKTDLTIDEKKEAKIAEKKARKHRLISHLWIVIAILSILFGIESIWTFADDLTGIISSFNNGDFPFLGILIAFIHSFEALLFIFFIAFSMIKYKANHKPWIKWWDDTEPLRVTAEIKVQNELYTKNIERVNALSLHYIPINKESNSDHELLSNLKTENKTLHSLISNEEKRRKEEANKK